MSTSWRALASEVSLAAEGVRSAARLVTSAELNAGTVEVLLEHGAENADADEAMNLEVTPPVQSLTAAESGQRGQGLFLDRYHSGTTPFPEKLASARALVAFDPRLARWGS